MPIHINLLAEAQAAEDLRRRNPVKRAIFAGSLLVALTLVWSSSIQLKTMLANSSLNAVESEIASQTNEYDHAVSSQKKVNEAKSKLSALQKLSASRFLQGNLLNALQQSTVDGVLLTRLHLEQSYFLTEGTAAQSSGDNPMPGRPATVTERILLLLDAQDSSANPGDQVNKFKDAIGNQSYFKTMLDPKNAIRLADLSAPQMGPDGRQFVLFTLECHFPEYTR
ncbi:MAG: hypothetical protein ABSG87_01240 [Verrucomicrobiota bacterium]|jgi:hypothetical protein